MTSASDIRTAGAFAADGLTAFAGDCAVFFFTGFFRVFFGVFFGDMWFYQTAGFNQRSFCLNLNRLCEPRLSANELLAFADDDPTIELLVWLPARKELGRIGRGPRRLIRGCY